MSDEAEFTGPGPSGRETVVDLTGPGLPDPGPPARQLAPDGMEGVFVMAAEKNTPEGRLIVFLYMVLRDHLPAGALLRIVNELEHTEQDFQITNNHLHGLAYSIAARLRDPDPSAQY